MGQKVQTKKTLLNASFDSDKNLYNVSLSRKING